MLSAKCSPLVIAIRPGRSGDLAVETNDRIATTDKADLAMTAGNNEIAALRSQ
ncbi:MAG: hypothetical protein AB1442_03640 [Nitrospirota bacterium]